MWTLPFSLSNVNMITTTWIPWSPHLPSLLTKFMESITADYTSRTLPSPICAMLLEIDLPMASTIARQHLSSQGKSNVQEIHRDRPNEASWTTWRQFRNPFSNFCRCLDRSLGDCWHQPAAQLRRWWPLLYSPSSDSLYVGSRDQ